MPPAELAGSPPEEAANGLFHALGSEVPLECRLDAEPRRQRDVEPAHQKRGHLLAQGERRAALRAKHAHGPAGDTGGQPDAVEVPFLGAPEIEHRAPPGERHPQAAGQGRGVGRRRQRALGQQRLVHRHAATAGLRPRPLQRPRLDAAAEKKIVLILTGKHRCDARGALLQARRRRYDGGGLGRCAQRSTTRTPVLGPGHPMPPRRSKAAHE